MFSNDQARPVVDACPDNSWRSDPVYRMGHCATVPGDPRPWSIGEPNGDDFELSCLEGNRFLLGRAPIADVRLITAQGEVCAPCRHRGTTICGLRGAASVQRVAALAALVGQVAA